MSTWWVFLPRETCGVCAGHRLSECWEGNPCLSMVLSLNLGSLEDAPDSHHPPHPCTPSHLVLYRGYRDEVAAPPFHHDTWDADAGVAPGKPSGPAWRIAGAHARNAWAEPGVGPGGGAMDTLATLPAQGACMPR